MGETESKDVRTEMDLKVTTALDSEAKALVPCPRGQAGGWKENLEGRSRKLVVGVPIAYFFFHAG